MLDSGFEPGSISEWNLKDKQGQAVADGSYLCVVTVRDLSGRLRFKQGNVLLQAGQASLQLAEANELPSAEKNSGLAAVSDTTRQAMTVLAHDGRDGRLVSTTGAMTFRLGNLFLGTDKELMRLSPAGNLGIGITNPACRPALAFRTG